MVLGEHSLPGGFLAFLWGPGVAETLLLYVLPNRNMETEFWVKEKKKALLLC